MNLYQQLLWLLELNPTLRQPDVMFLPLKDLQRMFPEYGSKDRGYMQYQYIGPIGPIELKESQDNMIRLKYTRGCNV